MRYWKFLSAVAAILVWPFLAVADGPQPSFAPNGLKTVPDSYIGPEGKAEVRLLVSHIGAYLPDPEKQQRALRELASSYGLEIERIYHDQLAFLRVRDDGSGRDGLVKLVRELRAKAARTGVRFGLAYREGDGDSIPSVALDEIVAGSTKAESPDRLIAAMQEQGFKLLTVHPYLKSYAVFAAPDRDAVDLMAVARQVVEKTPAEFAYPNFVSVAFDTETLLNDTRFVDQWHLRNTGQNGGTVDADADLSLAWDITQGAAGTIIAIHENGGFDTTHPDLTPNLWANPGEIPGNGIDDDGNGWVDDTLGWDFQGCTAATSPGCGDNAPTPNDATENHATAVAGVAAARGGNALGVSGSCPQCTLILLRSGYVANDFAKSLPYGYAQAEGARIVSNSWSSSGLYPTTTAAINAAATAGLSVVFAAGNTALNNCGDPRVGNNASVLAVSSSSNQDRKVIVSSIGNCVDVLSPSHRGYNAADPFTGTLNITTTDRQGAAGYNNGSPVNNCPTAENAPPPANARDYTECFGGTSSATPLTAGVIGLIETVNGTITRTQIQNLIQDTTDRIEDSVGQYAEANGFSAPGGTPTHSWGRLNAFEAVRIAAPVASGGKGGVDVFIRDNRLDWGNTAEPSNTLFEATRGFIPHWRSVDIKVDAPPYAAAPTTNAAFEAFADENPVESTVNRVYVRVRNRGPVTAESVTVKFHWAFAGTALPALPADFWTAFPADSADTSVWHPEPAQTIANLAYSGASVAGTGGDAAQILSFDFHAPAVDPTAANPRHYCVMVVLDSPQDPIAESTLVVDVATPRNNNMTHRNLSLQDSDSDSAFRDTLMVRNPFREPIRTLLIVDAPEGWKVDTGGLPIGRPFALEPQSEKPVRVYVQAPKPGLEGEVSLRQLNLTQKSPTVLGGFDIAFRSQKRPEPPKFDPATLKRIERLLPRLESGLDRLEKLLPRLEQRLQ
ncbi:MAG: S8 family serine peptidase [Alphaproteobacteria bacterium]|nr:S8 family serine peptidase [Alphaproteobacteria bacterium]MCB9929465.1 S8 family serine peptidase [Alphaproteobacteria bacterium]